MKNEDLLILLDALDTNIIIETLNVEFCDLELEENKDSRPIIEALENNCSLTHFSIKGNGVSDEAKKLINKELEKNKKIVELIFPTIRKSFVQTDQSSMGGRTRNSKPVGPTTSFIG